MKTPLLFLLLISLCQISYAQSWDEIINLSASDGATTDSFGWAVSISGDKAVVGAYRDADNGNYSGSAYIFELISGTWIETQKITPSDASPDDNFGSSVSILGDIVIVGAWGNDDTFIDSGSAYVFKLESDTWVETQKLTASDPGNADWFGSSLAIDDGIIIIGASRNDDGQVDTGCAYMFELNGDTWVETQKLTASDALANDRFGYSVAIHNNKAVLGAFGDSENGEWTGSAYVFELISDSWIEQQKLTASDAVNENYFGYSVAISDNNLIVGAYGNESNTGAAYLFSFESGDWVENQKVTASNGLEGDRFGSSVDMFGDKVIVGAFGDVENGDYAGSAYIYQLTSGSWNETQKLIASDNESGDYLGHAVSISNNTALVGAWGNTDNGDFSGSAYLFETSGLNISEIESELLLSVYPNPSNGEFSISSSDNGGVIHVYSADGRTVYSSYNTKNKILNISTLKSGVYFVQFSTGLLQKTVRLVIQ